LVGGLRILQAILPARVRVVRGDGLLARDRARLLLRRGDLRGDRVDLGELLRELLRRSLGIQADLGRERILRGGQALLGLLGPAVRVARGLDELLAQRGLPVTLGDLVVVRRRVARDVVDQLRAIGVLLVAGRFEVAVAAVVAAVLRLPGAELRVVALAL